MKSFETVKGLECCQTYHECSKCPYDTGSADTDECKSECMKDAAELINEKQTEIERLQHILISFMNEVEVLERKYGADTSNIPAIAVLGTEKENIIKQTKTEAVREFMDNVNEKLIVQDSYKTHPIFESDVDLFMDVMRIVEKEMAGDGDA